MNRDGLILLVNTPKKCHNGQKNVGSVYFYDRQKINEKFTLRQRLDGDSGNDYFGRLTKVTLGGLLLIVSAFTNYAGENSGSLFIYYRENLESDFKLQHRLDGE